MSKEQTTSSGCSILGVVQIVFIILKLVGVIEWSWPIVLIPLWISLGCLLVGFIVLFAAAMYMKR